MNGKKKYIILLFLICILILTVGYIKYYLPTPVKIKCTYMAYACGDCYPQFRIDDIYSDNGNKLIKGEDVYLKIIDNGEEKKLEEKIDSCWICYDYYIDGKATKHLFGSKTVLISKYHIILRKNCCDK